MSKSRKRSLRREVARRKADDAHGRIRIELSLPLLTSDASHLRMTYLTLRDLRERLAANPGGSFLLDMERCPKIDPGGILMLRSELDRATYGYQADLSVRWPRARMARFAVTMVGFRGEGQTALVLDEESGELQRPSLSAAGSVSLTISSGARGEPTGAQTFQTAKLAERFEDPILADRVHAALNEAADNVLSWAYQDPPADLPIAAQRWWAIGLLKTGEQSTFIALDHGATIPATAPKVLGDSLPTIMKSLREKRFAIVTATPRDADVLQATINYKRSQSRKGERGKGLTDMIGLIDRLDAGEIVILSGDAVFAYRRSLGEPAVEVCRPLGWRFDGTMIIWFVGGSSKLGEAGGRDG